MRALKRLCRCVRDAPCVCACVHVCVCAYVRAYVQKWERERESKREPFGLEGHMPHFPTLAPTERVQVVYRPKP